MRGKEKKRTYIAHLLWSEIHVVAGEKKTQVTTTASTEVRSLGCEPNVVQ